MAFRKVVVAYDGSDDSVKAVRTGCSISLKYGASMIILHVYHSPTLIMSGGPGMPMPDFTDVEKATRESGQQILANGVQAAAGLGVKAVGELVEGASAVEAIVSFASAEKADLIVIGTRGRTGFKKLVMGSVSSGVASHAECPVMVVR